MNSYSEYIHTGVEWVGDIPSTWSMRRASELFQHRNQTVDDISFPPLSVTMNGILDQMENVAKTDNNANRKLVRNGDFAINSRSDRKGSSGIAKRDGSVSVINIVLEPTGLNDGYCEYLLKSHFFKEKPWKKLTTSS